MIRISLYLGYHHQWQGEHGILLLDQQEGRNKEQCDYVKRRKPLQGRNKEQDLVGNPNISFLFSWKEKNKNKNKNKNWDTCTPVPVSIGHQSQSAVIPCQLPQDREDEEEYLRQRGERK